MIHQNGSRTALGNSVYFVNSVRWHKFEGPAVEYLSFSTEQKSLGLNSYDQEDRKHLLWDCKGTANVVPCKYCKTVRSLLYVFCFCCSSLATHTSYMIKFL